MTKNAPMRTLASLVPEASLEARRHPRFRAVSTARTAALRGPAAPPRLGRAPSSAPPRAPAGRAPSQPAPRGEGALVAARVTLDFAGVVWLTGPTGAREACVLAVRPHQAVLDAARDGRDVLVARLADGRPVVLGVLDERLSLEPTGAGRRALEPRVVLEATEVLELVCGGARLELRADGQVSVSAERVRASALGDVVIVGAEIRLN
jgi:hypothetical protein